MHRATVRQPEGATITPIRGPGHSAAIRVLEQALASNDFDGWIMLSGVLSRHLDDTERAGLAWAILRAMPVEQVELVVATHLDGAGMPCRLLGTEMEQAAFWADRALPQERDAYCLATFQAMPPKRQAEFLAYVRDKTA